MKKIAVIFTGGTISMKIDERLKSVIPALSDEEIMSKVTGIEKMAQIIPSHFGNFPGPHINPSMILDLANKVNELLEHKYIDGVVVTHGTDTLEETAYFLDKWITNRKPVVVTGAMRNSSELGYDGPANLSASICTACDNESFGEGVLVVLNNHIYSADEVMKTHTLSLDTFKSLDFGPLGIVDQDNVIFYRKRRKRHIKINSAKIEEKVALVKAASGMGSNFIKYCIKENYKGIVIEGMGRGNVPPFMVEGIKEAIEKGIPVVIVSRCPRGRVLDSYGYEGGGRQLREMGVILGENLSGQKARIKLMLILGKTNNYKEVRALFEEDLYEKK
ncbi:MAG: asparaginase [bacterium]